MRTLLYGSDRYRLNETLRAFLDRHRAEHGSVPLFFDLDDPSELARFTQAAATPSFFHERRIFVVHDPLTTDALPALEGIGTDPSDIDLVLVQATAGKASAAQAKGLTRLRKTVHEEQALEPLADASLAAWAEEFCRERGTVIDRPAGHELVRRCGNDTWTIANELEKLCAYASGTITVDAVHLLVASPSTLDQWELANALARRDKRATVTALWRRAMDGTPEPLLVGSVAAGIRTLLMVRDLSERGRPTAAIAAATGLHPFVVSKNTAAARTAQTSTLQASLTALAMLDRRAKEGGADTIDGLFAIVLAS